MHPIPKIHLRDPQLFTGKFLLHQKMLAGVVAAQDDVVDLADVHQPGAARITDGALHVLLHLAQRVGQRALDRLEDAFALDVFVLAPVEVRGAALILP